VHNESWDLSSVVRRFFVALFFEWTYFSCLFCLNSNIYIVCCALGLRLTWSFIISFRRFRTSSRRKLTLMFWSCTTSNTIPRATRTLDIDCISYFQLGERPGRRERKGCSAECCEFPVKRLIGLDCNTFACDSGQDPRVSFRTGATGINLLLGPVS
jgi:hypothetical protein